MTRSTQAEALRRQLASADRSGAGKPYPDQLRRAVVAYTAQTLAEGGSVERAARDTGVSALSISRWTRRIETEATPTALRRVEVVAEPGHEPERDFVVFSRGGLRIERLSFPELLELVRAVG